MAYNQQYELTFATKNNTTAVLKIYSDGYSGSVVVYDGINISLEYLATSDNVYEPIYASQMNVSMDVTGQEELMPNLVTLNDRKYYCKLYINSTIYWYGWILSDNVSYSYSTGRKILTFNIIDGLGLLDYIPFPFTETTSIANWSPQSVLYFIYTCLNQVAFPDNLNIYTVCSYYSSTMENRTTHAYSEPFSQSYLRPNYYLKDDGTYESCLSVLRDIVASFGCRLFQAGGKWNIISINEFASNSFYYTEYDSTGTLSTYGTDSSVVTIQPYLGNTSGLYFVNNSQVKLLKKGYNNLYIKQSYKYPLNYIANYRLKTLNSGSPVLWTTSTNGTGGSVTLSIQGSEFDNRFIMVSGADSGGAIGDARIVSSVPGANKGDTLTFKMTFFSQDINIIRGKLILTTTAPGSGGTIYYLNKDSIWQDNSTAPYDNYYQIPSVEIDSINQFSITTPPLPQNGQLSLSYAIFKSTTTQQVTVSSFQLVYASPIDSVDINSIVSSSNQYSYTIDLPLGNPTYTGDGVDRNAYNFNSNTILALISTTYQAATGWYRFGKSGTYQGLSQLIMKQYVNSYRMNLINLDCDIFGLETSDGRLDASKVIKSQDVDSSPINVSNNFYMFGNSTTNIVNGTLGGTLLQISNEEISSTINTIYKIKGVNE